MMQHQDFHFSVSEKDRCFSSITSLIARPFFAQSLKKRLDMPLVHGYRVQIAACDSEEAANLIVHTAELDLGVDGSILYEKGTWKARLGNFNDKNSASDFCVAIRDKGYIEAFVVESPIKPPAGRYRVQVSSHETRKAAEKYAETLRKKLETKVIVLKLKESWKVHTGNFTEKSQADILIERLRSLGFEDAFITEDN